MIQATNELILGIELNEQYAQITYYHQSVREPMTLGTRSDPEQYRLPAGIRCTSSGKWRLFDGALPEQEDEPDLCRFSRVFGIIRDQDQIEENGHTYTGEELLARYLEQCMSGLKLLTQNTQLHVMVTVRELTEVLGSRITQALEQLGVSRKRIYVQDYLSSFYYYTVNQKKELWRQDVALLTYEEEAIVGYVLHIDRSTRPALAKIECVARQFMNDRVRADRDEQEWNREKDRLFFELLKKVFERRTVSVSYLVGPYFNRSWAERSIQYLCYRRHAYQGMNLYSRGACYAAMERAGMVPGRDILFGGRDMIEVNLGMEMRIRGKETFYPLVSAGINWYEAHHVCEFILDQEREIRVISKPMAQGDQTVHMMRLPGLPHRVNRGTRLRMTVYFTSPSRCRLEVEDLGFGGFYRPSGLVWHREIRF